jgi:hypothetical protein
MVQHLKELNPKLKSYVDQLWQQKWDSLNRGDLYHRISPKFTQKNGDGIKTRKVQVVAFKLRSNAYNLNSGLHSLGHHNAGSCDICNQKEAVDHLLIECQRSLTQEIKDKCRQLQIELTVKNMINYLVEPDNSIFITERLQRKI